jgi:hypothetical protein
VTNTEKELQVDGITRQDFEQWKHDAVTKLYRQYLRDKRAFIERAVLDRWLNGALSMQEDQTIRGQIVELIELSDLPFEAICAFYKEDQEGADAAPSH